MKYFLLVFFFVLTSVNAKSNIDYKKFTIDPNPVDSKAWRSSTIFRVIYYCVKLGGNIEDCSCSVDKYRANYKENELLKVRAKYLNYLKNNADFSKDKEVSKMLSTGECITI